VHDNSLAGPLLAFNRSIPTVVTAHGPAEGEIGEYYRLLSTHVSMVAISNAQRRMAPDLPWVETIYNAIDVDDYPFRTDKDDFLLWLGRTNPDKGAHLAIDIARDVGERIVLAGKCTEPEESTTSKKRLRLASDPVLSGRVRPMPSVRRCSCHRVSACSFRCSGPSPLA
jgi:glycosyltransferase involved in cell wall biosynthesis